MNIIDIKGNIFYILKSKTLILFKFFYSKLSLRAGEYIKMAVTNSTHSFRLSSLVCVCVCVCVCVLVRKLFYALTAVLTQRMVLLLP